AGRHAIERAGITPGDIDLLVLATTTPDQTIPASSATVQTALGLQCGAFDINAACSGFVYAMVTAHAFTETGLRRVLVIGSDTLSRITDWTDRGTAILFADGAGAVVVEHTDETTLLGWDLGCDGTSRHTLDCDIGGHIHMDGREVFRRAVRAVVASAEAALQRAGVSASDIDWLVP